MLAQASMNQLANERQLAPFASWDRGRAPAGYVTLPASTEASRFFHEHGYLVVEGALSPSRPVIRTSMSCSATCASISRTRSPR
jgi:hypothetical protein